MSEKGSVYQKGGGGTNFEQLVQTAFVATMIVRGNVPCVSGALSEVAMQVTNRGYETDDMLAIVNSESGTHRLLLQIKHELTISDSNNIFNNVISSFWKDYNNTELFDKQNDKLIIVKGGLTKAERHHFKMLFNWACNKATAKDFISEVNRISEKKKYLDIIRVSLQKANNNITVTDEELFGFVRCCDILEYDLQNEGSVDKANFLNLIKLAKSPNSTKTEYDIWNDIFNLVSATNPNGGSITIDSLRGNTDIITHFDIARAYTAYNSVRKLESDSKGILATIKNSIGEGGNAFFLPRLDIQKKIVESIINNRFTIVTGKPGVGKSAIAKDTLDKQFPSAISLVFKADQLSSPAVANVLGGMGLLDPIKDIVSCIALIPEKIIVIDALEKLLEADNECAFRELLAILKNYPQIKIIATSREYAINLLLIKFGIENNSFSLIKVPELSDSEVQFIAEKFQGLKGILENKKIKNILTCPKYLDFVLKAIRVQNKDISRVSLIELKKILWDALVANTTDTRSGMPIKRENAFLEIAVNRAKNMTLYHLPQNADPEAIEKLKKDEIIIEDNNCRQYSSAHDILEDWALVNHIARIHDRFSDETEMFSHIGFEPAMRRAFRLWVEDELFDGNVDGINELIRNVITNQSIDKYWTNEILVAVFRSMDCRTFFDTNKQLLLANNCTLLIRCLDLIRTCCKEPSFESNSNLLVPIGSGWRESLVLLKDNPHLPSTAINSIYGFINDWYIKLLFQYGEISHDELLAAKSIVLRIIENIENCDSYSNIERYKINNIVTILFDLVDVAESEINILITDALKEDKNITCGKWEIQKALIESCLSGIGHYRLVKAMPQTIIKVAEKCWKYVPQKYPESLPLIYRDQRLHDDECWGFKYDAVPFPSGVYKTPFYTMLLMQPIDALDFIVDIINYSIDFYINNNKDNLYELSQIEMELNDGTKSKKWGADVLWVAYRGFSLTNHLMESLLMGLEKYLLETAERNTEVGNKNVKFVFDYVLKNSNNIAPIAVLSSVAMAYPEAVGTSMLPLLRNRELFDWDINRASREMEAMAFPDPQIPFAQEERYKSNMLPHRKKYRRGLVDFIIDYQLTIKSLNKEIFEILDTLKKKCIDDVVWKKNLTEMDVRNYQLGKYDAKLGGFPLLPKYTPEVKDFVESNSADVDAFNKTMEYSAKLRRTIEGKNKMDYRQWCEIFEYYCNSNIYKAFDSPISLAKIGLEVFHSLLVDEQKSWCLNTLEKSIEMIIKDSFEFGGHNFNYNILEKDIALSSFHLLMQSASSDEERNNIVKRIVTILISNISNPDKAKFEFYLQSKFAEAFPKELLLIRNALIKFANYKQECVIRNNEFITDFIDGLFLPTLQDDLSTTTLSRRNVTPIIDAIIITPYKECSDLLGTILPSVYNILLNSKKTDDFYSEIMAEDMMSLEQYLAAFYLNVKTNDTQQLFAQMINAVLSIDSTDKKYSKTLRKFVDYTLDFMVLKLYDNGNLYGKTEKYEFQKNNFWGLWDILYENLPDVGEEQLKSKLLFNIQYLMADPQGRINNNTWQVLKNKKDFYRKVLLTKGRNNLQSAIAVFSSVGGCLLPDGIGWIVEIMRQDSNQSILLATPSGERLIRKHFNENISKIKNSKKQTSDFLYILNIMVDLGSSTAYFIRENVITYKKVG